jgi:hypothetical protein
MEQTAENGAPYATVTSEVIDVTVTSAPESGGLTRGDKIAIGVGVPAAVFGFLGLFGCIFANT